MYNYSKDGITVYTWLDTRTINADGKYPIKVRVNYQRKPKNYPTGKYLTKEEWESLPTNKSRAYKEIRESIENSFSLVRDNVEFLAERGDFSFELLNTRLGKATGDTLNSAILAKIAELESEERIGTMQFYQCTLKMVEEFAGKNISFSFYATDSNGRSVSYDMGTYFISNMDIKLDMIIPTDSYLSISDMAVYTNENMPTKADKIDLVYLYRRISGIDFLHALVSPGVGSDYLPEIVLPEGVNRMTSLQRTFGAIDQQLARDQYGTFIDDLDFYQMNFSNASNFIVNIKKDAGTWVETADGIYRAFIYVNKVDNAKKTMTISVKRLRVK